MKINKIIVENNFMYIWLKSVEDVDLTKHCAKCLIGEYNESINKHTRVNNNIQLDNEKIYYLCGVSKPYVWDNNFHLAFRKKEGNILNIARKGISIEIEDAEEITFSKDDIDEQLKESTNKQFNTCRNWQFANKYVKCFKK